MNTEYDLIEFRSSWQIHYLSWVKRTYPNILVKYEELHSNTFDTFKNEFVIPVDKFYSKYCPNVSINTIDEYFYKKYISHGSECKLFSGIPKLIQALHTNNTLYILSTLDSKILNVLSEEAGIFNYFKNILNFFISN